MFSASKDVDILPAGAGKGKALEFVLAQLKEAGAYPRDGLQARVSLS